MKALTNRFVILLLLAFLACKDEGSVVTQYDVDARLVGDWFSLDTLGLGQPSPKIALRGMRINATKIIQQLGIEFSTGRLALIDDGQTKQIVHADDGLLVVQYFAPPDMATDSIRYSFGTNTLVLAQNHSTTIYKRTSVGSQVANPEQATMSVIIDSVLVRSPSVAAVIPVYVTRWQSTRLQLRSIIPDGTLLIEVDHFVGTGSYTIGAGKGTLMFIDGDVAIRFATDSLSAGTIDIDQYDETAGRCTGRFAFTARLPLPPNYPPNIRRLASGSFSAPLFLQ
ncbi:MAG: hypothetical protein HY961_22170 [Ignavibacteriae bacterium]|nr:hypothetical protein [Ignavibacteriota bacterium]